MRTISAMAFLSCTVSALVSAQTAGAPAAEHKTIAPDAVAWGDAPPVLAKGAMIAVLYGDPSQPGMFIVRFRLPADYKIMPHWHPTDENVTVL